MIGKTKGVKWDAVARAIKQEKAEGRVVDLGLKKSKKVSKEMESAAKSLSEKTNPSSDTFISEDAKEAVEAVKKGDNKSFYEAIRKNTPVIDIKTL